MAERTTGVRRVLSLAPLYQTLQRAVGARRLYRRLVRDFLSLQPGMRILDIGCGPADIVADLPPGVEYFGFDLSERYIESARARFGNRGQFWAARVDQATVASLPRFDRVLALGVLHHLDDGEALSLFELATGALNQDGLALTYDPCWSSDQSWAARYLISRDRGQNVRRPEQYAALAESRFPRVEVAVLSGHLRIPYTATVLTARRTGLSS